MSKPAPKGDASLRRPEILHDPLTAEESRDFPRDITLPICDGVEYDGINLWAGADGRKYLLSTWPLTEWRPRMAVCPPHLWVIIWTEFGAWLEAWRVAREGPLGYLLKRNDVEKDDKG